MTLLLWVIYPYVALTVAVVATLYRYDTDPYGWTAKSSEILEKRKLLWGSTLFHWGILAAFGGHLMGIMVPMAVFLFLGVPDELYHMNALAAGGLAGIATSVGLVILTFRRFGVKRILRNSTFWDLLTLIALIAVVTFGMTTTIIGRHEYRLTVGPWFRGILTFHPDTSLMATVPWWLQVHVLLGLLVFALVPFTRLVHIWSIPLAYLRRAPIQFRFRVPVTSAPESRDPRK